MYCIQCGAGNADDALFCQKCGKRFETTAHEESTLISSPPIVAASPYESTKYGSIEPLYPPPPPNLSYGLIENPYEQKVPLFAPSPRKGNRRILWIILSIISGLVLIAVAGFIYFSVSNSPSPQKTFNTLCTALLHDDYQTAYNLFSSSNPVRQETEQQYATNTHNYNQTRGGFSTCVVSDVNQTGSSATGIIVASYGNGTLSRVLETLVDENGVWKISKVTLM